MIAASTVIKSLGSCQSGLLPQWSVVIICASLFVIINLLLSLWQRFCELFPQLSCASLCTVTQYSNFAAFIVLWGVFPQWSVASFGSCVVMDMLHRVSM